MLSLIRPVAAVCAFTFLLSSAIAQSQNYPNRPITMMVGFSAGGATDTIARVVAEKLSTRLGQPVIVENKPGANTVIATNIVRQAAPDGYTLYAVAPSFGQAPSVTPKVAKYDPIRDFTPIAQTTALLSVLFVNPKLPVKTVTDLIAYGKANPGKLAFATSGVGATDHLGGELFSHMTGVKFNFIPYKGGALANQDVASGVAQVRLDAFSSSQQLIAAGRLQLLAVMEPKRHPKLPQIPAIGETMAGLDYGGYFGVVGPKGMPPELITRLNNEINSVLKMPEVESKFSQLGLEIAIGSAADFGAVIQQDASKWRKLMDETGLKIE